MIDIYNFINELTKFEITFKDENNIPHCYRSHIKSIYDDRILIAPPTKNNRAVTIKDGQKVKMIICTQTGVYTAETQVLSRELEHTPGLWMAYPHNTKHSQRREYLRAPLDIDFELIITKSNKTNEKIVSTHQIKDISGKGLSFVSDEPLTNYYDIEANIKLKDNDKKPLHTSCEHIYSNQYVANGKVKYIHALAFIDIPDHSSEKIIKQCFKHQLEHRRKQKLS